MDVLAKACRPGAPAPADPRTARAVADALRRLGGWARAYPASVVSVRGGWIAAGRTGRDRKLALGWKSGRKPAWVPALKGADRTEGGAVVRFLDADARALAALRRALPHLRPRAAGRTPSFGFGDRTGLGTPGHLRALGRSGFFPVVAQQSIREMTRTRRTPEEVVDDAVFGAVQEGWVSGFGADADHLKTAEDVARTAAAGFVMFTLDAADEVVDAVGRMTDDELTAAFARTVAEVPGAATWEKDYDGRTFRPAKGIVLTLEGRAFREAAVKYGKAIARWAELEKAARRATRGRDCEIEVSGDETASPTTLAEHHFIVRELRARGCRLDSLAPRFVGDFEKGIDYIGDVAAFEASCAGHAALARAMGGYKISVHSGSDKFSIYPAVARATKGRFHLKTAGTSWLEALRAVARRDAALFREVVDYSRGRFAQDSASYFISGRPEHVAPPAELADADLERVYLDGNAGRQVLHVTYGSVMTVEDAGAFRFRERILDLLAREEETYFDCLRAHLGRHVDGLRGRGAKKTRLAVHA